MKNFQEKEVKDLATVNGGKNDGVGISATVNVKGWFDGSNHWFDGIKGNSVYNEFDDVKVVASHEF